MPQERNCGAMRKISQQSLYYSLDESRIKVPSNLNYDEKIAREMGLVD